MDWQRILDLIKLAHGDVLARNTAAALASGAALTIFVYVVERHYGKDVSRYRRMGFWEDVGYHLYYTSGLHRMLFMGGIAWLARPLEPFRLNLLMGLPFWARFIIFTLAIDFIAYWYHRWEHANKWLWPFHAVHHAQKDLNLFTQGRAHPVSQIVIDMLLYVPIMLMGATYLNWLPYIVLNKVQDTLQHSQIPWRFGPLYYVFVSPAFHNVHHSIKTEQYDSNYSTIFSFWDFLFGTAVTPKEVPSEFGLTTTEFPSLRSQLLDPFLMAFGATKAAPDPSATDYRAGTTEP
jgi:sterol desaturase/sphingolipid hydroxylase (fatty acid hydroxylase superfamily)